MNSSSNAQGIMAVIVAAAVLVTSVAAQEPVWVRITTVRHIILEGRIVSENEQRITLKSLDGHSITINRNVIEHIGAIEWPDQVGILMMDGRTGFIGRIVSHNTQETVLETLEGETIAIPANDISRIIQPDKVSIKVVGHRQPLDGSIVSWNDQQIGLETMDGFKVTIPMHTIVSVKHGNRDVSAYYLSEKRLRQVRALRSIIGIAAVGVLVYAGIYMVYATGLIEIDFDYSPR